MKYALKKEIVLLVQSLKFIRFRNTPIPNQIQPTLKIMQGNKTNKWKEGLYDFIVFQ
jgi:hypothetical protein